MLFSGCGAKASQNFIKVDTKPYKTILNHTKSTPCRPQTVWRTWLFDEPCCCNLSFGSCQMLTWNDMKRFNASTSPWKKVKFHFAMAYTHRHKQISTIPFNSVNPIPLSSASNALRSCLLYLGFQQSLRISQTFSPFLPIFPPHLLSFLCFSRFLSFYISIHFLHIWEFWTTVSTALPRFPRPIRCMQRRCHEYERLTAAESEYAKASPGLGIRSWCKTNKQTVASLLILKQSQASGFSLSKCSAVIFDPFCLWSLVCALSRLWKTPWWDDMLSFFSKLQGSCDPKIANNNKPDLIPTFRLLNLLTDASHCFTLLHHLFEMVSFQFGSIWSSLHHSSSAFAWSWQVCRIDEGRNLATWRQQL